MSSSVQRNDPQTTLLFVYGTLRTEYGKIGQSEGPDHITGGLFNMGAFPGYHPIKDQSQEVIGEVIRVLEADLPVLDRYEGLDQGLYTRERVTTRAGRECWVYQINPEYVDIQAYIPSGDWFDRQELKTPPLGEIRDTPST